MKMTIKDKLYSLMLSVSVWLGVALIAYIIYGSIIFDDTHYYIGALVGYIICMFAHPIQKGKEEPDVEPNPDILDEDLDKSI